MAKMNNLFKEKADDGLVKVLSNTISEFEKTHKGNGLKSPFRLSQYWLDGKKWTSSQALIKAINSLNVDRKSEGKLLIYIQPNKAEKIEAVLVRLTDDVTLFTSEEPKEAKQKQPSKESLLKSLEKAINAVASASADGGWQEEYQALLKKYCK